PLVALDVPGEADARRPVVAVEAALQGAILDAGRAREAGEVDLLRDEEGVEAARRQRGVEDARAEQLVVAEAHPLPAHAEVEGEPRGEAVVVLEEAGVVGGDEV